jgi:hypothetical protein
MLAMLDLVDDVASLPEILRCSVAEDLGDLVGCQPPQARFTAPLEHLVDGEVLPVAPVAGGDPVPTQSLRISVSPLPLDPRIAGGVSVHLDWPDHCGCNSSRK